MSLDINTPRGQESVVEENQMLDILKNAYQSSQFFHTPITRAALIDGFIVRNNELMAIYESKCRRESRHDFKTKYNNEWLISHHKINSGASLSKALAVPLWGFLYLVPDRQVIAIKITDDKGNYVQQMRIERRKTSKCCNGGTMLDTCVFINITNGIYVNEGINRMQ
jgi:hypothetical protein